MFLGFEKLIFQIQLERAREANGGPRGRVHHTVLSLSFFFTRFSVSLRSRDGDVTQTTTAHGGPRESCEAGDALGLPSAIRSALAEVQTNQPRPGPHRTWQRSQEAQLGRRTDVTTGGGAPEGLTNRDCCILHRHKAFWLTGKHSNFKYFNLTQYKGSIKWVS